MKTISAKQARQNFADLLNQVYYGKEKILITKSGKPRAILVSLEDYQLITEPKKK